MSLELGGYNPDFFSRLMEIEDQHFWFVSRNYVIAALVKQIVSSFAPGYQVLELGCGTGNTLRVLEQNCSSGVVTGMDLYPSALQYARQRVSCSLIEGNLYTKTLPSPFHLIGLFDVLEHIPEDVETLSRLNELLVPGGAVCLTVPAHPFLWSYFDEVSHHCRRYSLSELKHKLRKTGFHVEYISYFMASIFPLVWLKRFLSSTTYNRNTSKKTADELLAEELKIVPGLNQILKWLLIQESYLVKHRYKLPMGTSIIAIAYKQ